MIHRRGFLGAVAALLVPKSAVKAAPFVTVLPPGYVSALRYSSRFHRDAFTFVWPAVPCQRELNRKLSEGIETCERTIRGVNEDGDSWVIKINEGL